MLSRLLNWLNGLFRDPHRRFLRGNALDDMTDKQANVEPLGVAEDNVVRELDADLGAHLDLTADLFNFIGKVMSQLPDVRWTKISQPRKVIIALMMRLANDLRCASLLAIRGYPAQAAGLVASMYEVAQTIVFIGANEERAERWNNHDHLKRPFMGAWDLTMEVMRDLGVPDLEKHVARRYQIYTQLCMEKHANPISEKADAFQVTPDGIIFTQGPRSTPQAVRTGRFALEHAASLSFVATAAVIQGHIEASAQDPLERQLKTFHARHKQLHEESRRRYPEGDPFPGKW